MSQFSPRNFNILFNKKWPATGLAQSISDCDLDALCEEYKGLKRCAPRRANRGKRYFVDGHSGGLSTIGGSNRFEEHLAIALWRLEGCWPHPDGGRFCILDYQFPLKARQSDKDIGKVDLLGVTDEGRLMVIELKVRPEGKNNRGESPAAALMQGLRYAAIVEANHGVIAAEATRRFNVKILGEPPIIQILAPKAWWRAWSELSSSTRKKAGYWEREFFKLTQDVENKLGVAVECVALDDLDHTDIAYGSDLSKPQLDRAPTLYPFWPDETCPIGAALPLHRSGK